MKKLIALLKDKPRLYEIIFGSDTPAGKAFDIVVMIAIVVSLLTAFVETIPSIRSEFKLALTITEYVLTFFFTKVIVDYYNKHSQGAFKPTKKFVVFLLTSFLMCYMFVEMSLIIFSNTLSGVEGEKNRIGSFAELDEPMEVPPYFIYDYEDVFFYKYMVRK